MTAVAFAHVRGGEPGWRDRSMVEQNYVGVVGLSYIYGEGNHI